MKAWVKAQRSVCWKNNNADPRSWNSRDIRLRTKSQSLSKTYEVLCNQASTCSFSLIIHIGCPKILSFHCASLPIHGCSNRLRLFLCLSHPGNHVITLYTFLSGLSCPGESSHPMLIIPWEWPWSHSHFTLGTTLTHASLCIILWLCHWLSNRTGWLFLTS